MIRLLVAPAGAYNLAKLRREVLAAWPSALEVNEIDDGAALAFYFDVPPAAPTAAAAQALMDAHDPAPTPPSAAESQFTADKADVLDFFTDADVDAFLAAANGTATNAQRDAIIKRTVRAVRSLARATRFAVRQLND